MNLPVPTYAHYLAFHAFVVVGGVTIMAGIMVGYMEWWARRTLRKLDYEKAEAQRGWRCL